MVFRLLILMLAGLLSACEPAFIAEETTNFSKKVGLIDDFNISRWHNLRYSKSSHITLVSYAQEKVIKDALLKGTEKGFIQYFSNVQTSIAHNRQQALLVSRGLYSSFLIEIAMVDSAKYTNMDGSHSETYKNASILLTVIDVNSGRIVDKVSLLASKNTMSFLGADLAPLIHKPMAAVAKEMVGG